MRALLGSAVALMIAACSAPDVASDTKGRGTAAAPPAEAAAAPASTASASVTDLGEVAPGTEVGIDVAEGTLGFNVVVTGNDGDWVGVTSLISPSGVVSIADYTPAGSEIHVAIGSRGLGAFNVPQTDATTHGKVETGRWRLVVGGITIDPNAPVDKNSNALPTGTPVTAPLHVVVNTQKTDDGEFHGGTMDLHVYIPDGLALDGHTLTAADAPADAAMNARLDTFYAKLHALFQIDRGNVTFHAIDASFLAATDGPTRAALIQQASIPDPQALQVVYTNDLSYGGSADGALLGYSVGLPGAANSAGGFRSAITVASYPGASAETDAVTMVHEMGHFVGLLHSTEFDGEPDLLADTPTCGTSCGKNDPIPDANNLMYPADTGEDVVVSPSQIRVMQGSPIYRANPR